MPGHLGVPQQTFCLLVQACSTLQSVIGQVIQYNHELIHSLRRASGKARSFAPDHLGVLQQQFCLLVQTCSTLTSVIGQVIQYNNELMGSVCYLMALERH